MTPMDFRKVLGCVPLALALVFAGCGDDGSNTPITPDEDPVDTTPPAVPAALAVHGVRAVDITVQWDENSEADLAGYVLQRSVDRGTTWETLTTDLLQSSTYVDRYWSRADYRVAAVDMSDNQSAYCAPRGYIEVTGGPKYPQAPLEQL